MIEIVTCDDCGAQYLGPPVYSFPPASCIHGDGSDCTGVLCIDCISSEDQIEPDAAYDDGWRLIVGKKEVP